MYYMQKCNHLTFFAEKLQGIFAKIPKEFFTKKKVLLILGVLEDLMNH